MNQVAKETTKELGLPPEAESAVLSTMYGDERAHQEGEQGAISQQQTTEQTRMHQPTPKGEE